MMVIIIVVGMILIMGSVQEETLKTPVHDHDTDHPDHPADDK